MFAEKAFTSSKFLLCKFLLFAGWLATEWSHRWWVIVSHTTLLYFRFVVIMQMIKTEKFLFCFELESGGLIVLHWIRVFTVKFSTLQDSSSAGWHWYWMGSLSFSLPALCCSFYLFSPIVVNLKRAEWRRSTGTLAWNKAIKTIQLSAIVTQRSKRDWIQTFIWILTFNNKNGKLAIFSVQHLKDVSFIVMTLDTVRKNYFLFSVIVVIIVIVIVIVITAALAFLGWLCIQGVKMVHNYFY